MKPRIIVIDGKTYTNVDEMPPGIRQKYEQAMKSLGDADNNQIPDAVENMNIFADKDKDGVPDVFGNLANNHATVTTMKIVVDGKEFNRLEDLPPDARARYEEALGELDADRDGIPDFAERMMGSTNQTVMSDLSTTMESAPRSNRLPASPTITPDTSNGFMLVLAGVFLALLCAAGAGAVWYFFLR